MQLSLDVHAQAVRDRQAALRRDADEHRLVVRTPRAPLPHRLRCLAARLRLPATPADGCGGRTSPAGSR
jgi:hypothetical protein